MATVETRRVSALEDAQRREREAQRRVTLAQGNVSRAKERVAAAQKLLATSALRQYAGIGTNDVLDTLSAPDTNSADRYGVYARLAAGANADGVDRLRSARQDEDLALTLEKEQSRRAKQARATRATSLADVRAAKRDRERITASIENRLERSLAEAEALASIDGKVSAELTRRQNALIAAIRADEARLAQLRARLGKGAKAGSGGSGSGVYADVRPSRVAAGSAKRFDCQRERSLRRRLDRLTAPITHRRSRRGRHQSFRRRLPKSRQSDRTSTGPLRIERLRDLPGTRIFVSPSDSAPWASMHEQGLAIDFTASGSLITSRSSPAFQWMRSNAARYGLRNLPSEPWHWSTNGN